MSSVDQSCFTTLVRCFAEAANSVIGQVSGKTFACQSEAASSSSGSALLRFDCSGALEGQFSLSLTDEMILRFAAILMGEAIEPSASAVSEAREAAAEMLQQIAGAAADRMRAEFGSFEMKVSGAEIAASEFLNHLVLSAEQERLEFDISVSSLQSAAAKAESVPQSSPAPEPLPIQQLSSDSESSRNLDLLLDLELPVTLRFGGRQMLLKEILDLNTGSVVELDRKVQEPVDLLIDNRKVAEGEVVIVDGNYGLRITQVASRAEKIAFLP